LRAICALFLWYKTRVRVFFWSLILAILALCAPRTAIAFNNPDLLWQSLETPHFRITFYSGTREIAEHVADIAEGALEDLGPELGWQPTSRAEVVLTDYTDSANGSATGLPYNAIRLNVTAPDDLSPLGDYDDWQLELVTHELTHIVHMDQARGLPPLVNAIIGRTWQPNQVQPRWILEGLAVLEESKFTSAGRMRSSLWDMYMRTDVLEDNIAGLDRVSNSPRRWPQGNIWYLYGSHFLTFISETYGASAMRNMIRAYSSQPIPWGINRAIKKATGHTFEELYDAWVVSMKASYGKRKAEIIAKGLRQGRRLTFNGQNAAFPRWIPKSAYPEHEGWIAYYRNDGHSRAGQYAVEAAPKLKAAQAASPEQVELPVTERPLGTAGKKAPMWKPEEELLFRTSGDTPAAFTPEGDIVFSSLDVHENLFSFLDLHRYPAGTKDPSGQGGDRVRLSNGFRAAEPSVSPNGREVVFVSNHRGTRTLQWGRLVSDHLEDVRPLRKSLQGEQVFAPRFSPDGSHVCYSVWTSGGYRDIRYLDVRSGDSVDLTKDRAMDSGCSFSPDGKYIFFHSDRTSVANIFAWELATSTLHQVTNVVSGAYYPELSPDGKSLAYIGYSKDGFDLFVMDFSAAKLTPAEPFEDPRPALKTIRKRGPYKVVPYNPLHTLAPRRYSAQYTQGAFGPMGVVSVAADDIAGLHSVSSTLYSEFERPDLQGNLSYSYEGLPVDMSLSAYRSISPRKFDLGGSERQLPVETIGISSSVSFRKPRMYDAQSFSLGYSVARAGVDIPRDVALDPFASRGLPVRGLQSFLTASYSYSNAESFLWSIGPERGFSFSLDVNATHPALASDYTGFSARTNVAAYIPVPWPSKYLRHHTLALNLGAGMSAGNYPGRGNYFIGAFSDTAILDTIRNVLVQSGVVLRGYPPGLLSGSYFTLGNLEYRFPIVNIDWGPSSLPFFVNRLSGSAFLDYGSAFDNFKEAKYKTGTGAELWLDLTLGYFLSLTFRAGYMRGLTSEGIDKAYFVAAVPY
jgi:Omp85 superfamily domain/WD40-like Beta Propeller Repeat